MDEATSYIIAAFLLIIFMCGYSCCRYINRDYEIIADRRELTKL